MKKVLIVAFHFPPQAESSGYLRALKFCRYLPEFGWHPTILTVKPRAYERTNASQLNEIPPSVCVKRVFALDTQRHLSWRGRYWRSMALPDRWVTWCLGAIPQGYWAIRKRNLDVILTTFPIATAILIGWTLHRLTRKPWVVDLRDSITEPDYPRDTKTWRVYRWLEKRVVHDASRVIFTAKSAIRMYLDRYPELSPDRCTIVLNGFDEEDFRDIRADPDISPKPVRLVHMGLLYPVERDPTAFFRAVSRLQSEGKLDPAQVRIELRASGYESQYERIIRDEKIEHLVHLLPPLPYHAALQDATDAHGLLLFQAACCDHQIPAKVFEYLRLSRPILALTSQSGDTAALLRETGGATIVDLSDSQEIYNVLPHFLQAAQSQTHPKPRQDVIATYSRQVQAERLAQILDAVVSENQSLKS